ncbi:protein kinase domain-containing protein [Nocardia brevicatena]|uniref:protein kinase domain-containing protein n=1 Tax=Nocardia brevicatena TaxID=37327 RepID=UPI0002F47EF6|nr:protein kinase [Nocardia brevicatena]
MTGSDPLRTQREPQTSVAAELETAGFEDALEVGSGGFGVVYRCRQTALDRTVAVKVLTAEFDEDNRARFVREQRAMGRLTGHPNIVTVLQVGVTAGGHPYLVTPYYPLGSLETRIRRHGLLPMEDVLQIGVKIAGALESAHRLGVLHRDVKPGNILLTDYGEPALTDFGIAHIADEFQTAKGTVTGSPAFTAPEVLEGGTPTPAADVYGLGATLFSALTGHAAFERRSGENMVTQFLRITTQPVPDLRANGIDADVSALVESAMSRNRDERPSAADFGRTIRQVQQRHGFPLSNMALQNEPVPEYRSEQSRAQDPRPPLGRGDGNLPLEMTSLINRRTELTEVKNLLATSRLVTLTGIGGVGKSRPALRAASQARRDFPDGVWLIELADVSDASRLIAVTAATLGVRDETPGPLFEELVRFLGYREALLVLDNCEQMVEAAAAVGQALLQACPDVRLLVTSREPLNIAGEAVLRVPPLTVPEPNREPPLLGLPRFDAVTLFAERAAAAVPGFELNEDNKGAVARICTRLDGLPLAIELAAARMRTLSPQQILQRLDDRYSLLTRATRTAPTRQQILRLCIDWSYELCTPVEQQLWAQLSVFAGSCELDAVEGVCDIDPAPDSLLDVLASLVDKSILIRDETDTVVRFRMLDTLRDYGRQKLQESGHYRDMRRRHHDWYQRMLFDSEAGWIGAQQPVWIARLEREQPNLRDALEFCLSEDTDAAADAGLCTAAALYEFWNFRGLYGEGRSWLNRVLARPKARSVPHRVEALCAASKLTSSHGEFQAAAALLEEARTLAGQDPSPKVGAGIAYADGMLALARGESGQASSHMKRVVELTGSDRAGQLGLSALAMLGIAYELRDDTEHASEYYREVLSITEPRGEVLHRAAALRGLGVAAWQQGEGKRARELLAQALRVNSGLNSTVITAYCLEAMAWLVDTSGEAERAAVLMGAAQGVRPAGTRVATVFHNMLRFHSECERMARRNLGDRRFDAAYRRGLDMSMDAAVTYALGEQPTGKGGMGSAVALTKRERQVAGLVAQGLSNKQIAAKLVISQRTAQGHVEHILSKLGFTSRAQIAAWVAEHAQHNGPRA